MTDDYKHIIKREGRIWIRHPMYWVNMSLYWIGVTAILIWLWFSYDCITPIETIMIFLAIVVCAMALAHSQQAGINHLAKRVSELEKGRS